MKSRPFVGYAAVCALSGEGALLVMVALAMAAYVNAPEDGPATLVIPTSGLLRGMVVVGIVLIAGAVGTLLHTMGSRRFTTMSTVFMVLAALANVVVLVVSFSGSAVMITGLALGILVLQATHWSQTRRKPPFTLDAALS